MTNYQCRYYGHTSHADWNPPSILTFLFSDIFSKTRISVNYDPLRNQPASDAGQSVESPMFAAVPAWERSKKPRKSFGTSRTTTTTTGAAKTAGANRPNTATLALGAGVVALGALAVGGWYMSQPRDTGVAVLAPGQPNEALVVAEAQPILAPATAAASQALPNPPTMSATAPTTVDPLPTEASTAVTSPEAPADPPAPTVP